MKIEQIYTGCLAEAAYYIESEGEVAIIDPLRETSPYIKKSEQAGARIKYVFETHFHADFVSGHLDLAKATGATIVFGPNANPEYSAHKAHDGEEFKIGKVTIKVIHTPGHTMESSTYLLKDENGKDYAIFTGDTLFIGDVGRPDLAIKTHLTMHDLAGHLFDSLRNKIMTLDDDVLVYPAHGAGSACGKHLSDETFSTLGQQKQFNYALRANMTREEFIKEVTEGLAPPPQYFPKNAMINKTGYESLSGILDKGTRALDPDTFEDLANNFGALVLDTRHQDNFVKAHIPNAIFIGIDGSFAPWVGALITDIKQPILIVADEGREEEVVTRLARVGYDHTLGYLKGGIEAWTKAGKETESLDSISSDDFAMRYKQGEVEVADVRKHSEYEGGHVAHAINLPLDFINENMSHYRPDHTYYLHCEGGYRSVIAASILKSRGFHHLVNIEGGYGKIKKTGLPLELGKKVEN
jgi:glyoxylase-like metal-dependent hydrolase (beta-lactamase superfamily II)/rhodanese-related sulfurtransferase